MNCFPPTLAAPEELDLDRHQATSPPQEPRAPLVRWGGMEFRLAAQDLRYDERGRSRRARARHLPQSDRGDYGRADARCLFFHRHAADVSPLVIRQALRAR